VLKKKGRDTKVTREKKERKEREKERKERKREHERQTLILIPSKQKNMM